MTVKRTTSQPEREDTSPAATRGNLVKRLQERLGPYYGSDRLKSRVSNPAIPNNVLEVYNWPKQLEYVWVPAPTGEEINRSMAASTVRVSMIQKGWQYYPSADMGHTVDGELPFVVGWEDDNGKVNLAGNWLMYADRDIEQRKRTAKLEAWNERRTANREGTNLAAEDSHVGKPVVQSESGKVSVMDMLKNIDG